MRRTVIYIAIFCMLSVLFLSCSKPSVQTHWDKDYYSYRIGAYINGIECHERNKGPIYSSLFEHTKNLGFYMERRDNWLVFSEATPKSTFVGVAPNYDSNCYYWQCAIAVDVDQFNENKCIYFHEFDGIVDPYSRKLFDFDLNEIAPPWAAGYLIDSSGRDYSITNGWIRFGEFAENIIEGVGVNVDRVEFEFTAISEAGEIIRVEKGYVSAFTREK